MSLGIIPLDADRSALWPVESFFLSDDAQANTELISGHLTITQPREIAMYTEVFSEMVRQAVYGTSARKLITAAIDALDDPPGEYRAGTRGRTGDRDTPSSGI